MLYSLDPLPPSFSLLLRAKLAILPLLAIVREQRGEAVDVFVLLFLSFVSVQRR